MKKQLSFLLSLVLLLSLCTPCLASSSEVAYTEDELAVLNYLENWEYGNIHLVVEDIPDEILAEFFAADPDELDSLIIQRVREVLAEHEASHIDLSERTPSNSQSRALVEVTNENEAQVDIIPFTSDLGGVFNGEVMGIITMVLDYTWEADGDLYINRIDSTSLEVLEGGPVVVRSQTRTICRVSSDGQSATTAYSVVLGYVTNWVAFSDETHTFSFTYTL